MKILHLEDCASDAELFGNYLRQEWPDCEIDAVTGRESYLERIARQRYDVILSDFSIAGFDGLVALQIAHQQAPDAPFIFLSGTIGEDRAVEAMRHGATDYVLKDRPKRLIPAIRRALAQVEQARDQRATEAQLLHAQRLENIGLLAAGVAHDFNNVLTPVLMGIPLVREHVTDPGTFKILATMEASVQRGASLVQQILGFAHLGEGRRQLVQPKHLVRELLGVVRQTFPKPVVIEERVDPDLWLLEANPTQLHQLFLNLCVNARDAMPEGGRLRFAVRNQELDPAAVAALPGAQPGRHVVFEVTDTGTGIAAENLSRIWEPFFTTKAQGHGTGLGLSTVRRIVMAHHGAITVHSTPERGTTFTVCLPAVPNGAAASSPPFVTAVPRGNGELILIVDDDQNVRLLTATLLDKHGYRPLVAANGLEALELFTPLLAEVRVLIVDLGLPRPEGFALPSVVRSLNPSVRVLAVSGVVDPEIGLQDQPELPPVLPKPFTAEALLQAVHQLLVS